MDIWIIPINPTFTLPTVSPFLAATYFPPGTDCVGIHIIPNSPWSLQEKEKLFQEDLPSEIKFLDLSFSGLITLPKQAFVRFPNLIFLSLEFNQLETLEQNIFQGLDHLRVLWLTGNHIQPEEDMYANGNLLQNHIENIHEETFIPLGKSLQVLLMHHNYLTSLPADTMFGPENMPQLRVLKLLDNPWKDEMKETFDKLHNSWDAAAAAAKGRVVCKKHKSSRGECLQLDVTEDSGDDLEDIWDEMHMSLADGDVLIRAMNDLPPHDENFDYQDYRYQDREEEDRESEL